MLTLLQARMSSTRLPGKVLRTIVGEPMLALQVERVRRARHAGRIVVATSDGADDDAIEALCDELDLDCFRGSLDDVLGRFFGAYQAFGPAEHVVRLTGDCPLADPEVIDAVIETHITEAADYTSNVGELTFPKGLDVEVFKGVHLATAFNEAKHPYEREHVTPFFYRNPDRFRLANLACDPPMGELRWTVDTQDDFDFVEAVYETLYPGNPNFTSAEVARLTVGDGRGREG